MAQAPQAAEYQRQQGVLADALGVQVGAAWALLDISALKKTLPVFTAATAALVQRYGSASAGVAADYYDAARAAAGVKGTYTVIPADPAPFGQVEASVSWATKDLWTAEPQVAPAKVLVKGAAERLVLDAGRNTIVDAVRSDRQARGWARVTQPGCCYFCAMLASRGAAYKSQQSASFQAHDHDRCVVEPVFGVYEMTAQAREWQALWRSSTKGLSGKDARNAFRQAMEGREVTAARHAAKRTAPKPGERTVAGRPESHVRAELGALEKSVTSPGLTPAARNWQTARIAQLRSGLSR